MNVVWYKAPGVTAPPKGYWCYGFLEEVFADYDEHYSTLTIPSDEGAVVIIPAEYHVNHVEQINHDLADIIWSRVILASDEQGIFPVERLRMHPNMELWVMTPHFEKHSYPDGTRFLGEYYPQDARSLLVNSRWLHERPNRYGFSGQITHERRLELVRSLENEPGYMNKTAGFTQGLARQDYYDMLVSSETVPAPSGPVTLDSFRAFEALEAGAVPILDLKCPVECDGHKYWDAVLGADHPLPTVEHWDDAIEIIDTVNERSPLYRQYINSWWQLHKRRIRYELRGRPSSDVTVLIPTSPIPSNPSTRIIDQTIESVRFHLPDADIIIMIDGVREEQAERETFYRWYVDSLLYKCAFEYHNVYPLVSLDHQHQANMTRRALTHVHTPLILFVEHDTPLVTDHDFMWPETIRMMKAGGLDKLRFHYEGRIHPEHEHLMLDPGPVQIDGVPVRRTIQWSQRPHLAGADYYRRILEEHFPETGRTMIEDKLHSVCQVEPWEANKLGVFHPEGTIVRSFHTDGRESDSKYDMKYD